MKQRAVRVARWVERMNRPDQDVAEYFNAGEDCLSNDHIPETLIAVLKILAEDLLPETRDSARRINQWLAENRPQAGTLAQDSVRELPQCCGLEELLTIRIDRKLGWQNNQEVWL